MNWLTECPMNLGELAVLAFIGGGLMFGLAAVLFCVWVAAWGYYDEWLEARVTLKRPDPATRRDCYSEPKS